MAGVAIVALAVGSVAFGAEPLGQTTVQQRIVPTAPPASTS